MGYAEQMRGLLVTARGTPFTPRLLRFPLCVRVACMLLFENHPANEHELYLKLFITCGGGL
jgi:hypothetical protein